MFHVINTHYDDAGIVARAESSWLIRRYAHDYVKNVYKKNWEDPSAPIILLGDFSMFPFQSFKIYLVSLSPLCEVKKLTLMIDSPPEEAGYKIMTSSARAPGGAASESFLDAYTHLATRNSTRSGESQPYGFTETYSGFKKPGDRSATRIDFIMIAKAKSDEGSSYTSGKDKGRGREELGKGDWEVARFGVVDNWIEGGVDKWTGRWSDHRLVRSTLKRVN